MLFSLLSRQGTFFILISNDQLCLLQNLKLSPIFRVLISFSINGEGNFKLSLVSFVLLCLVCEALIWPVASGQVR